MGISITPTLKELVVSISFSTGLLTEDLCETTCAAGLLRWENLVTDAFHFY